MANKAKRANWENHVRQKECLKSGIVMIPKKPIREKSKHKQIRMATMMVKAAFVDPRFRKKRAGRVEA